MAELRCDSIPTPSLSVLMKIKKPFSDIQPIQPVKLPENDLDIPLPNLNFIKNLVPKRNMPKPPFIMKRALIDDEYTEFMSTLGKPSKDFMKNQIELGSKSRSVLTKWMFEVCQKFGLTDQTYQSAVNYLDRYMSIHQTSRSKFQLDGCVCLYVSSKINEHRTPHASDYVYISDNAFSGKQLIEGEEELMKILDYKLMSDIPLNYLNEYEKLINLSFLDEKVAIQISNLLHIYYPYHQYKPSLLMMVSIIIALYINKKQYWNKNLIDQIKNENMAIIQLQECINDIYTNVLYKPDKYITEAVTSVTLFENMKFVKQPPIIGGN
jgi:hypothetical protein